MTQRAFDIVMASLLLTLTAPLLAVSVVAMWWESGRPVLFVQRRIGQNARPFMLYKIRTLPAGIGFTQTPAAHVTRVGAVLRRWGLDELPQLWNVLRGEMRLVGPRPTLPEQVARYGAFERQRLAVPPGITGWAQIHGRNVLDWPTRIRLDVWYVHHRSLWLDLCILARTPFTLLRPRGVDGPGGVNPDFLPTTSSDRA